MQDFALSAKLDKASLTQNAVNDFQGKTFKAIIMESFPMKAAISLPREKLNFRSFYNFLSLLSLWFLADHEWGTMQIIHISLALWTMNK